MEGSGTVRPGERAGFELRIEILNSLRSDVFIV
jgi:hypothetical protein